MGEIAHKPWRSGEEETHDDRVYFIIIQAIYFFRRYSLYSASLLILSSSRNALTHSAADLPGQPRIVYSLGARESTQALHR